MCERVDRCVSNIVVITVSFASTVEAEGAAASPSKNFLGKID